MRSKTVIRYYCDFCSKGTFRKSSAESHELTCVKNPNRGCFLCTDAVRDLAEIIPTFKTKIFPHSQDFGKEFNITTKEAIDWLRKEVGNCPACILAVLRQTDTLAYEFFDYKAAIAERNVETARELRDMLQ